MGRIFGEPKLSGRCLLRIETTNDVRGQGGGVVEGCRSRFCVEAALNPTH